MVSKRKFLGVVANATTLANVTRVAQVTTKSAVAAKKFTALAVVALTAFGLTACGSSDEFKPSNDAEKKALKLADDPYTKFLSYKFMSDKVLEDTEYTGYDNSVKIQVPCQIHKNNSDDIVYLYLEAVKNTYVYYKVYLSSDAVHGPYGIKKECLKKTDN